MKAKTLSVLLLLAVAIVVPIAYSIPNGGGFDKYGYNYNARIFVGIGENWYRGKNLPHLEPYPDDPTDPTFYWVYGDTYGLDHLVMKWSKAWDDARFHGEPWTPEAWCTNHWNGKVSGGSGEVWHYKIIWVGPELENSEYWREGGYPIWVEFEVIMSHGTVANEHFWDAHAKPSGLDGP